MSCDELFEGATRPLWVAEGSPAVCGDRRHVHASGFTVRHCGHPTALRPYYVLDPCGAWIGESAERTRNGRPVGLVFRRVAEAKAWVEEHVRRCLTADAETLAARHEWLLLLPHDWPFLVPSGSRVRRSGGVR